LVATFLSANIESFFGFEGDETIIPTCTVELDKELCAEFTLLVNDSLKLAHVGCYCA